MTTQDLATWQEQVEKELRGKPLEALYWTSPEGIEIMHDLLVDAMTIHRG